MGGEYLPDSEAGEVEIVRFELESTMADVISLRARLADGKIHYRLVDEYETDLALEWARDGLLEVASAYNLIIVLLTVGVVLVARACGLRVGMSHSL